MFGIPELTDSSVMFNHTDTIQRQRVSFQLIMSLLKSERKQGIKKRKVALAEVITGSPYKAQLNASQSIIKKTSNKP